MDFVLANKDTILEGARYIWDHRRQIQDWIRNEPYEHRTDHRSMAAIRKRKRDDQYDKPYRESSWKKARYSGTQSRRSIRGRQAGRQVDRHTHRHTDTQTHRQTDRHTDTQTDRQAGRQAGRQTDRQTDSCSVV